MGFRRFSPVPYVPVPKKQCIVSKRKINLFGVSAGKNSVRSSVFLEGLVQGGLRFGLVWI